MGWSMSISLAARGFDWFKWGRLRLTGRFLHPNRSWDFFCFRWHDQMLVAICELCVSTKFWKCDVHIYTVDAAILYNHDSDCNQFEEGCLHDDGVSVWIAMLSNFVYMSRSMGTVCTSRSFMSAAMSRPFYVGGNLDQNFVKDIEKNRENSTSRSSLA